MAARSSKEPEPGAEPSRERSPAAARSLSLLVFSSDASSSLATLPEVIGNRQREAKSDSGGPHGGGAGAESHPGGDGVAFTRGGRSGGRGWAGSKGRCLIIELERKWRPNPSFCI
ncbi:pyridoxal phosphate phosphatase PHOSPHO2 isoform X3 [Petaurus breviceps papuanus]|uniref:pyridoxal phosphate phosphatase PHOSPHO2 isoform X3 n=1 Tax=Petaurus breviceps papuanus TaxID=3040969 RepID=UPI0036DE3C81